MADKTGLCRVCLRSFSLTSIGHIRVHGPVRSRCQGSGQLSRSVNSRPHASCAQSQPPQPPQPPQPSLPASSRSHHPAYPTTQLIPPPVSVCSHRYNQCYRPRHYHHRDHGHHRHIHHHCHPRSVWSLYIQ